MRSKIETSHNILKSGCKAEEARLRTAARVVKLIAVFCILAWRAFPMTMLKRTAPAADPAFAIKDVERKLRDHLLLGKDPPPRHVGTLSGYLIKVAKLGGYRARAHDPPPGTMVMRQELSPLTGISIGATIEAEPMEPKAGERRRHIDCLC